MSTIETTTGGLQAAELRPAGLSTLAESVRGAIELDARDGGFAPRRLPAWTRAHQAGPAIHLMADQTLGVRLALLTAATLLEVEVAVARIAAPAGYEQRPASFELDHDGGTERVDLTEGTLIHGDPSGEVRREEGLPSTLRWTLGGDGVTERPVTLWLPHTAEVVVRAARADAPLRPAPASAAPHWVHHGSSISHGGEADGPRGPWAQRAATALGLELTDLGFSGNALLDPFVARTIADLPADVITLKLGINIVNVDGMRRRTLLPALHNYLDVIRQAHPQTPLLVITPITSPSHEDVPGPTREVAPGKVAGTPREWTSEDGTLTLARIRDLIAAAVASRQGDDPHLHLLDGRLLLGPDDTGRLPDDLHPDDAGHRLMADRFARLAREDGSPVASAFAALTTPATDTPN
ncbi:GDSL-type esterase/lipase family protein [Leifsonia sp. NPDC058194]|uniref:GDSL-type esterase/lipase family protein n=1 Tax=Leifsonia sp. NPDC058194 TaxID=3346374 RepID=UPI0036DCC60C